MTKMMKRKALINDAMSIGTNIRVDELDCSKSFARVSSEKTPQEVLEIVLKQKNTYWNFIHRDEICGDPEKFDVGFWPACELSDTDEVRHRRPAIHLFSIAVGTGMERS